MPGFQYYYYPFTSRNDPTLNGVRAKYKQKQNAHEVIGDFILPFLDPRGTLLVDGHSDEGSLEISARNGGTAQNPVWESIRVNDLARRLTALPDRWVAIRMLACKGMSFACALAITLGRTHPGIHVGGYIKSVFHVPGMRAVTDPEGPNTTNSGLVWWFDRTGRQVQKPAMPKWALTSQNAPFAPYDPRYPTQ